MIGCTLSASYTAATDHSAAIRSEGTAMCKNLSLTFASEEASRVQKI